MSIIYNLTFEEISVYIANNLDENNIFLENDWLNTFLNNINSNIKLNNKNNESNILLFIREIYDIIDNSSIVTDPLFDIYSISLYLMINAGSYDIINNKNIININKIWFENHYNNIEKDIKNIIYNNKLKFKEYYTYTNTIRNEIVKNSDNTIENIEKKLNNIFEL